MYNINTTTNTKEMVVVAVKTDTVSTVAEKKMFKRLKLQFFLGLFLKNR